ncbi:MAG: hypothetical protein R3E87_26660 [Burkholderiaceae bacterium]
MNAAKRIVFALAWLLVLPLIVPVWLEKSLGLGERLFVLCAQLISLVPGFVGALLRAAFYRATLDDAHWETSIGFGSVFSHRQVSLGANVSTGNYCVLGHVAIGARTRLASRVSIPSGKRQHLDEYGAISHGETHYTQVRIGADCWLGEGAIVLDDVGDASIVAAGAVVGQAMPGGVLIAGNPARVARDLPAAAAAADRRTAAGDATREPA